MAKSLEEVEALLAKATIIPGDQGMEVKEYDLDDIQQKMFDLGYDTKTRHVRDAAYWGLPVGTPIAPGQKPVGGRSGGRGGSSGGGSGQATRTASSGGSPKRGWSKAQLAKRAGKYKKPQDDAGKPVPDKDNEPKINITVNGTTRVKTTSVLFFATQTCSHRQGSFILNTI